MRVRSGRRAWVPALLAAAAAWCAAAGPVAAQEGRERLNATRADDGQPLRKAAARNRKADPDAPAVAAARRSDERGEDKDAAPPPRPARETVEADVSTRTIAVTSAFAGTEIIVFGSVVNSRQPSAEAGTYDIIVVLEGMAIPLTVRRKTNVAGLWINTDSVDFESVPSYYAIASTRPIEEIADPTFLERNAIGHGYARIAPAARSVIAAKPGEMRDFKEAVVRIKQGDGLYLKEDYAVIFIGKSLFRASIALPANVPVGPMTARVYLFREGELLSTFQSKVRLERSGIELWLYRAAMHHPLYYGLSAVLVATLAGWLASLPFRRRPPA
jgi:uncharacterized protein (TIGR02186 family)